MGAEFHSVLQQGADASLCLLHHAGMNRAVLSYTSLQRVSSADRKHNQHQTEKTKLQAGKENGAEKERKRGRIMILNQGPLYISELLVLSVMT